MEQVAASILSPAGRLVLTFLPPGALIKVKHGKVSFMSCHEIASLGYNIETILGVIALVAVLAFASFFMGMDDALDAIEKHNRELIYCQRYGHDKIFFYQTFGGE
jgi:hypothetical protein